MRISRNLKKRIRRVYITVGKGRSKNSDKKTKKRVITVRPRSRGV